MPPSAQSRFSLILFVFALSFALAGNARAELVWTPQSGWKVEGGALVGVSGKEAQGALEMMNKARAAEEKGNLMTAAKYYKRAAKMYPNSIYAPEAQYHLGKVQLARKKYAKSFEAFQTVALRYPSTTRYNEIIGLQYSIASALLDGARGRVFGIFPGFANREKGIQFLEILLIEAPYSDYAPIAMMSIAQGHAYLRNSEEAMDALDRMINTYPQSVLAPDAYLSLGKAHATLVEGANYDQASTRDSITYYEDFMILFPSDNNVAKAEKGLTEMKVILADSKMKIGDFYFFKRDNYKAARVFYNEAITVYPDSEIAAQAKQRLVEVDAAVAKASAPAKKKRFFFF
ncbi:MAG: outer membrane protein assembly factor BamD [Verrucomicrobia bacterium]|nr:outer membrane protein assembly factor BamD [Verrucomicrobiota bacterium]